MPEPQPLLHIGFHKTGTTWLQQFLFNNERAGFYSPFDRETDISGTLVYPHDLDFDPAVAQSHFAEPLAEAERRSLTLVVSSERLSGAPLSGGYDSRQLADRLKSVFPGGKVLIIIRDQAEMIRSLYQQYVKVGGPCSLDAFLNPATRGRSRVPAFEYDHFQYHRLIGYYQQLFGRERVLVLPYELFRENPREFVTGIIRFAGAPAAPDALPDELFERRVNLGYSSLFVAAARFVNPLMAPRDRVNPAPLIATAGECWLHRLLQKLDYRIPRSLKARFDKRLQAAVASAVSQRYRESNRATAELTGLNLERYGYNL